MADDKNKTLGDVMVQVMLTERPEALRREHNERFGLPLIKL